MLDTLIACPICGRHAGDDTTLSIGTCYVKDGITWEREEITWGCGHSTIIDYPVEDRQC